jgi:chromosome segregation ATPase
MSDNKRQIESIKSDIERLKSFIDPKKSTIQSLKNDKSRISDRYKDQIKRADKKDKERLREKKKYEIEGITKQILSLKKVIEDYKNQISRKREDIKRLKK